MDDTSFQLPASPAPLQPVRTEPALDEREYFLTGQWHAEHVLRTLRRVFDPGFRPRRVLDIGCGRGRVTVALAAHAREVVATESDPQWLARARVHADALGIAHIHWVEGGAAQGAEYGPFGLVHLCVAAPEFHREPPGWPPLEQVVQWLAPGGFVALHLPLGDHGTAAAAAALQTLHRLGVRQCHIELAASPEGSGAMLYFGTSLS
ncbi:MAG: hypothetical protein RI988_3616 [Pseudomonadota bacterium]